MRQTDFNDKEFVAFARTYLSQAFPNPERIACPSYSDLTHMAEHPTDADPTISEHPKLCSRCLKDQMEILARKSYSGQPPYLLNPSKGTLTLCAKPRRHILCLIGGAVQQANFMEFRTKCKVLIVA